MTTKAVTAGTDFTVGSSLNVNGISYVVKSIAGNTLTIVPSPSPNPTASTTDTLTGGTKVANGPTFPNVELADATVLTTAGGGAIPALPLTIANGGTGAATVAKQTVFANNSGSTAAPAFTNAPSVASITLNGATSGSNAVAAPAIAGTGTTTTLPAQSGTLSTEVAAVDLTGQNAAITTTTLFAVVAAGQYRVSWDAKVTTAAGVSSTLGALTIVYTDVDAVVQTITAGALIAAGTVATTSTGNSTTTVLLGIPLTLNCAASSNITYAFAYASSAANAMNYNLHIKVEAL